MKIKQIITPLIILSSLFFTSSASAVPNSDTAVVKLRQSCTDNGAVINNCFDTFLSLQRWVRNTRKPNASNPLRVDIGPGTFVGAYKPDGITYVVDMNIRCEAADGYSGYTSYQGSGSDQTILKGGGSDNTSAVNIYNCTELSFSDLKITPSYYGGIYWSGGGNSRWSNVNVDGIGRAWDEPVCGAERGNHYWFSSKVSAVAFSTVGVTYSARCDETWFYGSEIKLTSNGGGRPNASTSTINASGNASGSGIVHVYGSNLSSFIDDDSPNAVVESSSGGEVHIHGTGIDAISVTGKSVTALYASSGGMIHADASAYVLETSGTITRIREDGGNIAAPYQWKQSPEAPEITSITGADTAVVTNTIDSHPHPVIYDSTCASKWFDTVTAACRDMPE